MPKFNHAFTVAFSLVSNSPDGEDVTPAMFRAALIQRIADLDENPDEWLEACGAPFDTYQESDSD